MPSVLLLTALPEVPTDDNAALLAPAFRARGWAVRTACIDTLALRASRVCVDVDGVAGAVADHDLLWVLGFGRRDDFLDKMQLLARIPSTVRVVNDIAALVSLHGKYPFADAGEDFPQPETWAACRPGPLLEAARAGGGRWVLKPPGGSFGRGVVVVDAAAPELETVIEEATRGERWRLLQRWVPEVAAGEHRVLVAGGRIVGSYLRVPGTGSRAARAGASNLAAGGTAAPAGPDPARDALALRAAAWLARRGVDFAGLDLAGPWVLEANIVNPGGLATLAGLDGEDRAMRVVDALLA